VTRGAFAPETVTSYPTPNACYFRSEQATKKRIGHPRPTCFRRYKRSALNRTGYRAVDAKAGETALTAFEDGLWGRRYPAIAQSWRRAWSEVIPFYAFPDQVRRILYTTNAIEALNSKLRRAVRARGHFPNDEAAMKLLFLVLNRSEKEWKMGPREWIMAKAQFAVLFGERFNRAMAA
jgi:putative transposase